MKYEVQVDRVVQPRSRIYTVEARDEDEARYRACDAAAYDDWGDSSGDDAADYEARTPEPVEAE